MNKPLRNKIFAQLQASNSSAPQSPRSVLQQQRSRREKSAAWFAMAFVFLVLTICVSPNIFQGLTEAPEGSVWPYSTVVTPYTLTLPDGDEAESQRRRLHANHFKVFSYEEGLEKELVSEAQSLVQFAGASSAATTASASTARKLRTDVREKFGLDLQPATLTTLAAASSTSRTYSDLETVLHHLLGVRGVSSDKSLLNSAMRSDRALVIDGEEERITSPSLRQVLNYPGEVFDYVERSYLPAFQLSESQQSAFADLLRQMLRPNIVFQREETEKRLAAALAAVNPSQVLKSGTVIIQQGEEVTPVASLALKELSRRERQNDFLRLLGGSIVIALAMAFTGLYAKRFNRDLQFNYRSVLMVALPVVFAVSLGRVILNLGGGLLLGAFAMPAGMVGILTVMLFDERLAIVLTTMACGLFAVATGLVFPYTLIGLVGGYTAILSLRNLQERREVLLTGVYIALANCLMAVAVSLIINPAEPDFEAGLIAAVVNGLVCYALAVSALPIFENIFQVTTDVLLLELTSGNHQLLKMMEAKAPGSFHHSMNVANLAEAGAEAVGAHYLLVRAGAYFHDVGKMIKPGYFTENQSTPEQKAIHQKLSPAMSTLIIKNHVKEGVELARAYRLPEKVVAFIPEHHGTSLIKFFYVQALKKAEQEGSDEIISEDEYRYPGPKPRSVETAILMLADSVEAIATSRFAGKTPDEVEIRRAVHEAVTEKYEDRQLTNSPLTFKDLEIIKDAFARELQSRFHQRVKYPSMPTRPPGGTVVRTVAPARKPAENGGATGAGSAAASHPTGNGAEEKKPMVAGVQSGEAALSAQAKPKEN